MVAACTKSAQIPFSAWLPAAIAAPTPVSSLVHSSTLVTAGVYLVFRFSGAIDGTVALLALAYVGGATTLIAGIAAIYERDIKKIVALSTLRQLGLMCASLGLGFKELAFFHLLAHAYFKALLFMSVGSLIHLSRDYQDLRKISTTSNSAPVTLSFSIVANLSLCGLPFTSGFYSKDLILESQAGGLSSAILLCLLFLSVLLTLSYSIRLVVELSWPLWKHPSLRWAEDKREVNHVAILFL